MARFQNFFTTRLAADIGAADTTITLETAPTVTAGRLVIEARNATQREVIKYTGVSGNDITGVTRGEGGTTAKTHIKNSLVEMNATSEDLDDLYAAYDAFVSSEGSGWIDPVAEPSTVTYNGNHSYDLVFSGNDLTDTISAAMRLKLVRTVTPPTQCTDLESGSSQYWSKTSPAGLSFTTTFTCSAWVKLESYGTAGQIINRMSGTTEGWSLQITSTGTVKLLGRRIAANNKFIESANTIPLNKWVHVAACMDMTVGDTTAQKIWIDGVEVPRTYTLTGTATAIVQGTTPLYVGSLGGASEFFDGKIAQASVHSACLSDANIKAMQSQTISSSTPSIVTGFTFNGAATDVTANANNLTAAASAGYVTDSPFNATEYAIVTKASFSTDTTLVVQVPEGYAIPTSGGVSDMLYSTHKIPYAFPANPNKWTIITKSANLRSTTNTSLESLVDNIVIPSAGAWNVFAKYPMLVSVTGTSALLGTVTLSSDAATETHPDLTGIMRSRDASAAASSSTGATVELSTFITTTALTTLTLIGKTNAGTFSLEGGSQTPILIRVICAYL